MKKLHYVMAVAMALLLTTACSDKKQSNSYELKGVVEGMDGDANLLLANSEGEILDTIKVVKGAFSYSGKADSVAMYTLFLENTPGGGYDFFTEPGSIEMTLIPAESTHKLKGTVANDAFNDLLVAMTPYNKKIYELEQQLRDTTQKYDEWAMMERYRQLYDGIMKQIKEHALKNADNELGYSLLCRYIDLTENEELARQIVDKMPAEMKQRPAIKQIEEQLSKAEATSVGKQMADFTMDTPSGEQLSVMSEVKKNRITVLDFWASWCGPCRGEMPFMRDLYAEFHPKGLGIVGISLDENGDSWKKAIAELKIEWPQMSDLKGWECAAARTFDVNAIPFLVVVDSTGTIIGKGMRGEQLKEFVSQQLQ